MVTLGQISQHFNKLQKTCKYCIHFVDHTSQTLFRRHMGKGSPCIEVDRIISVDFFFVLLNQMRFYLSQYNSSRQQKPLGNISKPNWVSVYHIHCTWWAKISQPFRQFPQQLQPKGE